MKEDFKFSGLPPQQISFKKKNKKWRMRHLDWADSHSYINHELVRKDVLHKKINLDLVNGKLHMKDLTLILNPEQIRANYIPEKIQHYPIINAKLNLLRGEESSRLFDYRVVVTNPNSISQIENAKRDEMHARLQELIEGDAMSEEDFNKKLEEIDEYFSFQWQDMREVRANALVNHYVKEYNMPLMFNEGLHDGMIFGEEAYQCDIVGGEPVVRKVDPLILRVFRSGYSPKLEDADMIVLEDYWSIGRVYDEYHECLSPADIKYLEAGSGDITADAVDSMGIVDERRGFINNHMITDEVVVDENFFFDPFGIAGVEGASLMPFDNAGNVRVLKVFWKSRRKLKKVKSYDPLTGEEVYNIYSEDYVIDESLGEEEKILWVNQAWEGVKIGEKIYVNMRPRTVQYNTMNNPSRCHLGFVGSIYNINGSKPFSIVDMMKPYNYLYDVIHDRLNKLIARNWGTLAKLDLAKVPKGWTVEKWMYYAKTMGLAVEDSFKEGEYGQALGKLAGGLNNNSTGIVSASDSNTMQQYINLLEFIKMEMADVVGISKQREGQISNRETVGGVERSTLQSSHITEWLFYIHDDVKKRVLECFLETAKIALQGGNKKFEYILSDNSLQVMDIDGDEFAESDYGLIVDSSNGAQELNSKLEMLAQAALQNQTLNFSTVMKLYNSASLAEKERLVESNEKKLRQQNEQQQQMQQQQFEQQLAQQAQLEQARLDREYQMHSEDNETKVLVAEINSQAEADRLALMNDDTDVYTQKDKEALMEQMREFDAKIKLDREKFAFEKQKSNKELAIKRTQASKKSK